MISGVVGALLVVCGIAWTVLTANIGLGFFTLFGIIFVIVGIMISAFHLKNARSKNRYSLYDITDESEEPDPLNQRFGGNDSNYDQSYNAGKNEYCPYCGTPVMEGYAYCNKCGKKLP